jgi:hypothetical protein
MAEYGMVLTNIDLKPEIATAKGEQIAQGLTIVLQKAVQQTSKGIDTLEGGGWGIIAHDITKIGNNLIVSFLLRR